MAPSNATAAQVIRLTDFDQAKALFCQWQGRFDQLSRGRFEGNLRIVRGGLVRLVDVASNQRVLLRGQDAGGMLAVYPVTEGNAGNLWQGRRLTPGQLVIHGPEADVHHYSAHRTEHRGVYLRPELVEQAAGSLLATPVAVPKSWDVRKATPDVFARLNRELTRLLKLGLSDPTLLGSAEGLVVEQECVRWLVSAIFPTTTLPKRLTAPKQAQLVRRAEEFMRSRMSTPVGSVDLCRELGVSDRTLRLAFRTQYGLGPIVYHRCLRLNAVRSQLKAEPHRTIAEVARANGFHHLGNLAADYRRLFGVSPSATPGRT